MATFTLQEDIELVQELLGMDSRSLSAELGVSRMTLNRWGKDPEQASPAKLEAFYGYAFSRGLRLCEIHAQLFQEESRARNLVPLFHGSKAGIEGALSLSKSRTDNDFGKGLYCGESLEQAGSFVARFPRPVCYFVAFEEQALRKAAFHVNTEWMLAIALFRGKLADYAGHPTLEALMEKVGEADYVVAPIADNRMFDLINSFVEGEITDAQCEHGLSATSLGFQYVLRSNAALQNVVKLQPHYVCSAEKAAYLEARQERVRIGSDKAKAAKRAYRSEGRYIEELLS